VVVIHADHAEADRTAWLGRAVTQPDSFSFRLPPSLRGQIRASGQAARHARLVVGLLL